MITAKTARQLFSYDPEEGVLRWRETGTGRRRDLRAGSYMGQGYLSVAVGQRGVDKRTYQVHRVIWLIMKGRWPKGDIDHKDGKKANNKWKNLREATRSQNKANTSRSRANSTGYKGVSWTGWAYRAGIRVGPDQIYLGCHSSAKKAHAAYVTAAKKYYGEFARVR